MHDLKDWLPLAIMLAGLAVTYGRLNERLSALGDLMRRLEAKEDARSERERSHEGRIAQLQQALHDGKEEILRLRTTVEEHGDQIARILGRRPSDPKVST